MLRVTGVHNELLDGFRLREKRIEPLTGTVRGEGVESHLPSKSIEVLLCLAKNPRMLVSREALLEKVWGNADASQESLSHAISEIRHALGDNTDHPVFIQTVPKRGYRLLVEPRLLTREDKQESTTGKSGRKSLIGNLMDRGVIQAGAVFVVVGWVLIQVADAVVPILGLPAWTRPFVTYVVIGGFPVVILLAWFFEYAEGRFYLDRGRDSPTITTGLEKNYLTMVAAYAIAAAGGLIYQYSVGFDVFVSPTTDSFEIIESEIEIEPNSIAVLRFMNIDGSEKSDIFGYGFAEDVLDRLARIPGLLVSARGDSWSLPINSSSDEVRKRLRVAYYLEGSVRLVGNDLRVVAQLIDSATGFHLVSRRFNRKLEDFMEVQDEVTNLTVANLRVALPAETQTEVVSTMMVTDVDAYMLYRRGKYVLDQPDTQSSLAKARDYFQQALEIDPKYAAAFAGLCMADAQFYEISNDPNDIVTAESACAAALAENPRLHMVHSALGGLYLKTGRVDDARSAFSSALKINEQDVSAILGLAGVAGRAENIAEAERLYQRAIELQPGNWATINSFGNFLFGSGRYEEAAGQYRKVVFLEPSNWTTLGNLGSALMMAGDFETAEIAISKSLRIEKNHTFFSNLGIIYYYLGQFDDSVAIHLQVTELSPNSNFSWLNLADALYFSGDEDGARNAYEKSAELSRKNLTVDPDDAESLYALSWAMTKSGAGEDARDYMDRSLALAPSDPYVHYFDALLKANSGEEGDAIDAIETAIDLGYSAKMILAEPHLGSLHGLSDFQDVLDRASEQN